MSQVWGWSRRTLKGEAASSPLVSEAQERRMSVRKKAVPRGCCPRSSFYTSGEDAASPLSPSPNLRQYHKVSAEVYEAALEVQKHFGIGLPESLYQKCLARELQLRGHSAETEVIVPIRYKGYEFQEKLRIDVLVDRCLVVEAKALDEDKVNMPRHKAQCLSYMKLMNLPLGMVINFGDSRLGHSGIARVILKGANTPDL